MTVQPGGRRGAVVLVEGISDQAALETLARRRGRDLAAEGVTVVPIGGAQAIGRSLDRYGPRGLDLRLAGLCDATEEADFRRGLERAGLGSGLTRDGMERLGFYLCDTDPPSRSSPRSAGSGTRSSCGGSCGTARSATPRCSSAHSTSTGCRDRSTRCWTPSEPGNEESPVARALLVAGL
jgi:hypothetical protein